MSAPRPRSNSADRRVRRTRVHLRDALLELVLERGWDAVSVSDVCDKADIGRSTFYLHFADKEDLLLSGFDDLHAFIASQVAASHEPFAFAEPLILHARDNERLFRAIAGRQSGALAKWRFQDLVTTFTRADIDKLGVEAPLRKHAAQFVAGGFLELMSDWLEGSKGPAKTAELIERFRLMATGVVRAVTTNSRAPNPRPTATGEPVREGRPRPQRRPPTT
ncbi:MAG: TetR/AcrR family transcriptional regulator [Polyangiaceae bacterium]